MITRSNMWIRTLILTVALASLSIGEVINTTSTYIGGSFTATTKEATINGIGLLKGSSWLNLPNSPNSIGIINTILSSNNLIFLMGEFNAIGGQTQTNSIVQYNVTSQKYSQFCGGVQGIIQTGTIFEDLIIVGGSFGYAKSCSQANPIIIVNNVASFNLTSNEWSSIGGGLPTGTISSIAVQRINGTLWYYATGTSIQDASSDSFIMAYNQTCGTAASCWFALGFQSSTDQMMNTYNVIAAQNGTVYVGGNFVSIGGVPNLNSIAMWGNSSVGWTSLQTGLFQNGGSPIVYDIDYINGNQIVVSGTYNLAGTFSNNMNNIGIWDGTKWISLDSGVTGDSTSVQSGSAPYAYTAVNSAVVVGDLIFAAGLFTSAGQAGITVNNIAVWNNTGAGSWYNLGNDTLLMKGNLAGIVVTDQGCFVIGQYQLYSNWNEYILPTVIFAQFSNNNWTSLVPQNTLLDAPKIESLAANGSDIYVAGRFYEISGKVVQNVAKWDGRMWTGLTQGGLQGVTLGVVYSIAVHGPYVYVAGFFDTSLNSGFLLSGIARYDTEREMWNNMGGGINGSPNNNNTVTVVEVSENYVFIAGSFASVANVQNTQNIAMWSVKTQQWMPMGVGFPNSAQINDMVVNGTWLYVGGQFSATLSRPNVTTQNLAIWDMENLVWIDYAGFSLGSSSPTVHNIQAIAISGDSVTIGGTFGLLGTVAVSNIASVQILPLSNPSPFNVGTLAGGVSAGTSQNQAAVVNALAYDGHGVLYVGGFFDQAGGTNKMANFAKYERTGVWTSLMTSDVLQWNGAIEDIVIVVSTQEINFSSSPSNGILRHPWEIALLISLVAAILIIGIMFIVFLISKIRRRRALYIEIPQYGESRLSIRDLANDAAIKQIEPTEIELGQRIALGASGEVLKGVWRGRDVAMKRMAFGQNQMTGKFMDDFFYEIKIMSTLEHKNVLKFLGTSITHSGEVFLVTEYMEHGSIKDLLSNTENVDWKLKIRLAIDAARGMQYLHSCQPPIIHRDLKSSNLLIDKRWRCKIADFGISRIKPTTTQSMTLVGTPAYMAPEVISQNKYSEKGDVYSFGIVLCELYTGKGPYSEMNLFPQQVMYAVVQEGLRPTLDASCPSALSVLIGDTLHTDPLKRPDFSEVKMRLKRM
eukprot:TRINITY_DN1796_c0_g2_i1.p1 TRINITY_DN1796_c0_g2~~TRINITY_DN1796_c0_g2_i1.p1  ORF type:complete len:1144 (-),score=335.54 TRINITY_DN1796_c0_g2_i1:51-3482(-)